MTKIFANFTRADEERSIHAFHDGLARVMAGAYEKAGPSKPTMTPDQFAALAELLRLRSGDTQEVARLVLVDGLSVADAARQVGMGYHLAYKAVQRAQQGLLLARQATGATA